MHLLFKEGLDNKQVAGELNISIHTVKKHKLNGIKALKKKLGVSGGSYCGAGAFVISFTQLIFSSVLFLLKEKEPKSSSTDDIQHIRARALIKLCSTDFSAAEP